MFPTSHPATHSVVQQQPKAVQAAPLPPLSPRPFRSDSTALQHSSEQKQVIFTFARQLSNSENSQLPMTAMIPAGGRLQDCNPLHPAMTQPLHHQWEIELGGAHHALMMTRALECNQEAGEGSINGERFQRRQSHDLCDEPWCMKREPRRQDMPELQEQQQQHNGMFLDEEDFASLWSPSPSITPPLLDSSTCDVSGNDRMYRSCPLDLTPIRCASPAVCHDVVLQSCPSKDLMDYNIMEEQLRFVRTAGQHVDMMVEAEPSPCFSESQRNMTGLGSSEPGSASAASASASAMCVSSVSSVSEGGPDFSWPMVATEVPSELDLSYVWRKPGGNLEKLLNGVFATLK
ncbi:hypothetical protein CEUSTIGMA_g3248.t1 [Chlamydomonas eustigma]|uniref:Uncharacterized protein n=1 Tax=Chlamydomonas eustigma TaxID=1157962 RepID=A0A250WYE3_9CHLO|nr:hypothetical protein CEUSTIGMA_g3248.t1 [Chlamydomonas eustigma]|eukprot:GAX75805.1 hypothetical protein CEUSTIGMA_g3248.t1 [Chlamydomonas eustigma]